MNLVHPAVADHLGKRLRETEVQRDDLLDALSDTLNMLRAAHIQIGMHHDSNKRVIKARAALAAVKGSGSVVSGAGDSGNG